MYVIYALIDPRDNTVHYVGQTNDVYERFQQHLKGNGTFVKNAWVFELRAANRMVIMETLEEVETSQEALDREVYWIKHFEMLREPLSNAVHRSLSKKIKKDQLRAANRVVSQALMVMEETKVRKEVSPVLTEVAPSGDSLNVNAKVDTSKVSAEKRELIQRLVAMKVMNHRDIAKAVKLDGPKYAIYKQVCAEEGIEIK